MRSWGLLWPRSRLRCVFKLTSIPTAGQWVRGMSPIPKLPACPDHASPACPRLYSGVLSVSIPPAPHSGPGARRALGGPCGTDLVFTVAPHGYVQPSPPTMALTQMVYVPWDGRDGETGARNVQRGWEAASADAETPASPLQQAEMDGGGRSQDLEVRGFRRSRVEPTHGYRLVFGRPLRG